MRASFRKQGRSGQADNPISCEKVSTTEGVYGAVRIRTTSVAEVTSHSLIRQGRSAGRTIVGGVPRVTSKNSRERRSIPGLMLSCLLRLPEIRPAVRIVNRFAPSPILAKRGGITALLGGEVRISCASLVAVSGCRGSEDAALLGSGVSRGADGRSVI